MKQERLDPPKLGLYLALITLGIIQLPFCLGHLGEFRKEFAYSWKLIGEQRHG